MKCHAQVAERADKTGREAVGERVAVCLEERVSEMAPSRAAKKKRLTRSKREVRSVGDF